MASEQEALNWHRSSFSNGSGGEYVEIAELPDGGRAMRNSKHGDAGPVLRFTAAEWSAFVAGVQDGEFDL